MSDDLKYVITGGAIPRNTLFLVHPDDIPSFSIEERGFEVSINRKIYRYDALYMVIYKSYNETYGRKFQLAMITNLEE